jgi:type II secretory ATPase GspE/PulE/Tfp pilus assembly ATPase PilB-like protein
VDGVLQDVDPPPQGAYLPLVDRVKAMADLDLDDASRRVPQVGRIIVKHGDAKFDLRASTLPTVYGERVVVRILARVAPVLDIAQILSPENLDTVRSFCHLPNGVVVCTGPTGSGKTTLLYSMLSEIDADKCGVFSIEDPVEYHLDGVAQVAIDPRQGLTFPRVLRSILRQDPDVVLVGEIRDPETLQAVAQTALTGHLVLTTLHTATAPGAIRRMMDVGLEPFLLNSSLAAVIAQRLVRKLCDKCKEKSEPDIGLLPREAADFVRKSEGATFHVPKGCDACSGGYCRRMAIHEILTMDDRIRKAVLASADVASIRTAAMASGMKPMLIDGLERAAAGLTSIEEVLRVVPAGPNI